MCETFFDILSIWHR